MSDPEDIRAGVRRKRRKPPPVPPPPEGREERLLRKLAEAMAAMDGDHPQTAGAAGALTDRQLHWYWGTAGAFIKALRLGVFRRTWRRDRDLVRAVQRACAEWIEGDDPAQPA